MQYLNLEWQTMLCACAVSASSRRARVFVKAAPRYSGSLQFIIGLSQMLWSETVPHAVWKRTKQNGKQCRVVITAGYERRRAAAAERRRRVKRITVDKAVHTVNVARLQAPGVTDVNIRSRKTTRPCLGARVCYFKAEQVVMSFILSDQFFKEHVARTHTAHLVRTHTNGQWIRVVDTWGVCLNGLWVQMARSSSSPNTTKDLWCSGCRMSLFFLLHLIKALWS